MVPAWHPSVRRQSGIGISVGVARCRDRAVYWSQAAVIRQRIKRVAAPDDFQIRDMNGCGTCRELLPGGLILSLPSKQRTSGGIFLSIGCRHSIISISEGSVNFPPG